MKAKYINIYLVSVLLLLTGCIKPFIPTGIDSIGNVIVIEGDILQNDTTRITISRSLEIDENNGINYIKSAVVWVESEKGNKYNAFYAVRQSKPVFLINTIGIDPALKYKLCIVVQGKTYQSELVPVLLSPAIDSIGFTTDQEKRSATFYVNAHDSDRKTNFYRWYFNENWEIQSQYLSFYEYDPLTKSVVSIPYEKNRYYCWSSATSTSIIIENTTQLAQDLVYQKPIVSMGSGDIRISSLYSIELMQMAISEDAFKYWDNIKKNSDQIGGIFSPQPSEMNGNIKCITDPSEIVIGYISAAKISKKRIFAKADDIGMYEYPHTCEEVYVSAENNRPIDSLWNAGLDVALYTGNPPAGNSLWASKHCVDCRLFGTKNKPSFWPNNHI